jgi:hypothetical protein
VLRQDLDGVRLEGEQYRRQIVRTCQIRKLPQQGLMS